MGHVKTILLIVSLLGNLATIAFIVVLTQTHYLDLALAAYSHTKNCERDFDKVLGMADSLPPEQRAPTKQLFASVVCQKDYQTGRDLGGQNFDAVFKQLQGQVETPAPAQ
jgi:hypothetical protein